MDGKTDSYRIKARRHDIRDPVGLMDDQGHGTGPESLHQFFGKRCETARQLEDLIHFADMQDERIVRRPSLRSKDFPAGVRIEAVRTETVHRLRRESHDFPSCKERRSFFQLRCQGFILL